LDGAFDLLRQSREDRLEQTIITYRSLMTAWEQARDVEAASKVFRMVKEEEGRVRQTVLLAVAVGLMAEMRTRSTSRQTR
jgi:hypothetical protein